MNNDLISRSELKEAITKIIDEEIEIDEKWAKGLKYSLKIIDNVPTVEPERPQGEWKRHDEWRSGEYIGGFYHVNCPCKDGLFVKWRMKYCGNCGAPMQLDDEEEGETDG